MNKRPFLLLVIVALVAGGAVLAGHLKGQKSHYEARTACDILSANVAHQLQGNSLQPVSLPAQKTDSTTTTYCVYRGANNSVSLALRSPKNATGAAQNRKYFAAEPSGSLAVRGYGDDAFWSPAFGQLNILKNDNWYILSSGSNSAQKRTVGETEKLANQLKNNFE